MDWYKHLYVGETARKKRFEIIQKIRFHRMQRDTYVITPASNGKNLIDIYPSSVLLKPYYREQELLILGIARGYDEAILVAARIVDDLFRKTGGFDLQLLINENES